MYSFASTVIWCSVCVRAVVPRRRKQKHMRQSAARISGIKGFFDRSIRFSWCLALHQLKSAIARECVSVKNYRAVILRVNLNIDTICIHRSMVLLGRRCHFSISNWFRRNSHIVDLSNSVFIVAFICDMSFHVVRTITTITTIIIIKLSHEESR